MAIARPATKTKISTTEWGWPITDEVNRLSALTLTKNPRGCIGYGKGPTVDQAGFTASPAQIAGMGVMWVTPTDSLRTYKITASINCNQQGAAGFISLYITNETTTPIHASAWYAQPGDFNLLTHVWIEKPAMGVSMTRVAALATNAGSAGYVGSYQREGIIIVEDIGGA